jgi:hypothetical protein
MSRRVLCVKVVGANTVVRFDPAVGLQSTMTMAFGCSPYLLVVSAF